MGTCVSRKGTDWSDPREVEGKSNDTHTEKPKQTTGTVLVAPQYIVCFVGFITACCAIVGTVPVVRGSCDFSQFTDEKITELMNEFDINTFPLTQNVDLSATYVKIHEIIDSIDDVFKNNKNEVHLISEILANKRSEINTIINDTYNNLSNTATSLSVDRNGLSMSLDLFGEGLLRGLISKDDYDSKTNEISSRIQEFDDKIVRNFIDSAIFEQDLPSLQDLFCLAVDSNLLQLMAEAKQKELDLLHELVALKENYLEILREEYTVTKKLLAAKQGLLDVNEELLDVYKQADESKKEAVDEWRKDVFYQSAFTDGEEFPWDKVTNTLVIATGTTVLVIAVIGSGGTAGIALGSFALSAGVTLETAGVISAVGNMAVMGVGGATGLFGANRIAEVWTGENFIADNVFGGDVKLYNNVEVGLNMTSMGIVQFTAGMPKLQTGKSNGEGAGNGTYYRYMSEAEYNAVQETGYLRGGNSGTTYFTNTNYNSAGTAQSQLSLPNTPQYRVEFSITNNPNVMGGTTVAPDFGQLGGGIEFWSTNPVQVQIINAVPIP